MEEFLLQLTGYLNTENGMQIVQDFVVCIAVALFLTLLLYDFIRGTFIFLVDRGTAIAEWIYRHTNHFKKKHAKALAAYDSCKNTVCQLSAEDMISLDECEIFLKSLDEYKDRHI